MSIARYIIRVMFIVMGVMLVWHDAFAVVSVPGSATAGRFDADRNRVVPQVSQDQRLYEEVHDLLVQAPEGSKKIRLKLNDIKIEGASFFKKEELTQLYQQYIGKEVTLYNVWEIAAEITKYYQDRGFFLSRAYLPPQEIENGKVLIKIVEGYISDVEMSRQFSGHFAIEELINKIKSEKPANIKTLESVMIRLNDLPGLSFYSVLQPVKDKGISDKVKLFLQIQDKEGLGQVSFNNYNSRYLGPYQGIVSYKKSLFPMQNTSISYLKSAPLIKLSYFKVDHTIALGNGLLLDLYGGRTRTKPGYTLKSDEVVSRLENLGASVSGYIIRQREENLNLNLKIEGNNVSTSILNVLTTHDYVRAARLGMMYDNNFFANSHDNIDLEFSHGISWLNSSVRGDPALSRSGINPTFQKINLNINHTHNITQEWSVLAELAMQFSQDILYPSEQFGFGGQQFGRAYDSSEISGDNGRAFALEVRYNGIEPMYDFNVTPYGFFDAGKVWNVNDAAKGRNSTGFGFMLDRGDFQLNLTVAQPIMHGVSAPRHGSNGKAPRYLFQLSYSF